MGRHTEYVRDVQRHARGGPVNVPFHVTSHDWQKSDRLFAAIMTNFIDSQMGAIQVGGRGTFDGTLTKEFNGPRGLKDASPGDRCARSRCSGERATGNIVVENNYLQLTNGRVEYAEEAAGSSSRPGASRSAIHGRMAAKRSTPAFAWRTCRCGR